MRDNARYKGRAPGRATPTLATSVLFAGASVASAFAQSTPQAANDLRTATPIQHIIVVIGENRTFDHVYATYQPQNGEHVRNLLSEQIVDVNGNPAANFSRATQRQASETTAYSIAPQGTTPYATLPPPSTDGAPPSASDEDPPPFATVAAAAAVEATIQDGLLTPDYNLLTTGATGEAADVIDQRITNVNNLPSGPFQLTGPNLPYDSYTASPVHRFYQMWQQTDCAVSHATSGNPSGCLNDLFPWTEVTIGAGNNGKPQPAGFTDETTGEGASSMGFYNVAKGDAPFFKQIADQYTMSDNYHQAIMGGTGANHIALGTGLAIYYTDGQGNIATPPTNQIENPNPQPGTNNYWIQDGYSGGSYSNCSDTSQPGVSAVTNYLQALPSHPSPNCQQGAYYLLNNYNPGYLGDGTVDTAPFTIPPSPVPTIGDDLNAHSVSWRYYGAGWNAYKNDPNSSEGAIYCNICNPFQYETSIMTSATQRDEHLKDVPDLVTDIQNGTLPAVSIVKPDGLLDGHPASSKLDLFEAFSSNIIKEVQANPQLWAHTAILVTFDEGGGYWDSGYIQPLDFFGDGTRIPAVMVSPYSTGGHISHTYADHVSFLKFVERNWNLPPVSQVGRDALPNPVSYNGNPYTPTNSPAIGDLMDMFNFQQ